MLHRINTIFMSIKPFVNFCQNRIHRVTNNFNSEHSSNGSSHLRGGCISQVKSRVNRDCSHRVGARGSNWVGRNHLKRYCIHDSDRCRWNVRSNISPGNIHSM
ncbi:hypothetical protein V6N12_044991 [Hibiscus sabdariffa]|uniref:Uncharacterized protein n=1 Tax=Hibiscus sabdariffa TaxID=183260 RepID=A0ABR2G1Z8_9ROSI